MKFVNLRAINSDNNYTHLKYIKYNLKNYTHNAKIKSYN